MVEGKYQAKVGIMATLDTQPQLHTHYQLMMMKRMRPFSTYNTYACTCLKGTTRRPPPQPIRAATTNASQLKQNWLNSLSLPPPLHDPSDSNWVLGIDPDCSGALAVLKPDASAQVFDSPHLLALVGGRVRKRLDAKSIVMLLRGLDAPIGTTAYIEQSIPYPKDGKQGWWTGGFGYGLWIGILVASGFSVVPVPSFTWKNEFKLSGGTSTKDDSRRIASSLFPSLSSLLQRKKDHGRAEALLIAAYGKGLKLETSSEE